MLTNFEYYKDKLQQLADKAIKIGIRNGEPINCNEIKCEECGLHGNCWHASFVKWLYQEYVPYVDWGKVAVDTPILVSDDGEKWSRRYFAKYEKGKVYTFQSGATSWSSNLSPIVWKYAKLEVEE